MPPKAKDPKAKQFYKPHLNVKDLLPGSIKNVPRDPKTFKQPDPSICQIKRLDPEFQPFKELEDWPTDEVLKTVDFGLESNNLFNDEQAFKIPDSYSNYGRTVLFMRRPKDFVFKNVLKATALNQGAALKRSNSSQKQNVQNSEFGLAEQSVPQQILVCEQFERQETVEEFERRRKEILEKIAQQQIAAKDKKKSKKVDEEVLVEPTELGKVKDAKLNNIEMNSSYPADIKWIASVLQLIKDNNLKDANTLKPVTSKIYPQQEGTPVYNRSGRYWVKLYYMGKEKKIEIDDKIPVNSRGESIYVRTTNPQELWSMLLSKAIIKLYHSTKHFNNQVSIIGDGLVMYALTGLLSENINLQSIQAKEWQLISKILNEQNPNIVVSAYCQLDHKPEAPSNKKLQNPEFMIHTQIMHEDKTQQEKEVLKSLCKQSSEKVIGSNKKQIVKIIEQTDKKNVGIKQFELTEQQKNTNLQTGCSYSVVDFFTNETFNMVYVQKRSDRELRLRQEYYEICKANIHKMNKEEKLEHRRRKKELKEKLGEEDHKRIEQMTKPAHNHKLLKIKSNFQNVDNLNIACQFSSDEIYIAKKCMVNKLSKPPNYELPEIRGDDKSVMSSNVKINQQNDDQFIPKPLDDFSALTNVIEPQVKASGGNWVMEKDFTSLFQFIQLYYNPKKFNNFQIVQHQLNQDYELANNEHQEILVIYRNLDQEESVETNLIFGFQSKYPGNCDLEKSLKPSAVLQKYDLQNMESVQDFKMLNGFLSSQMLQMENKNNVFRLNVYSPLSYTLFIGSSNQFKLMSIPEYLAEFDQQLVKPFTVDYPCIEQNKYYVFARFKITGDNDKFLLRFKNSTDFNILKHLRIKVTEHTSECQMLRQIDGVHKNEFEKIININLLNKIRIKKNQLHFLSIEGLIPYNLIEGNFELEMMAKNDMTFELIDQVEPQDFFDKYIPYKYGVIFKEKIYCNEGAVATFYAKITEVVQQKDQGIDNKKGGKQTKTDIIELQEIPLKEDRSIKLELIRNDQVVAYSYGYNKTLLSNILLNSTKDESVQYILQCSFDLREWPNARILSPETENINFFLTVLSSDTLAVLKDTSKEDKERAIKKQWEDNEAGRAEKAKKCRRKYLIQLKKENGEQLTEEEAAILNQQRLTKKQREELNQQAQAVKGKAAKKDEKKPTKPGKVEVVEEKKAQDRVFPVSANHQNEEIKGFLSKLEEERVKQVQAPHPGLINIRSEESKQEIVEQAKIAKEDYAQFIQRSMLLREQLKQFAKDLKQQAVSDMAVQRKNVKDMMQQYLVQREELKNKISGTQSKEKQLIEICKTDKPTIPVEELDKLISEVSQIQDFKPELIDISKKVSKNLKISNLIDKLQNCLNQFEVEMVKSCIETINQNQVEGIDQELIERAYEMMDEAASNPNFVLEKQAELKKGTKKGKK